MSDAPNLDPIRELEQRVAELSREGAARADDPVFQASLNSTLLLLAQARAAELDRVVRLYRETARELEQHRRRMAVTVHDLKAPITISLLNLDLLNMEQDPEQSAFYLTGVRRELEFMLDTIANLLDLERGPDERAATRMEPVPLKPLIEGVIARMSVLILDKPDLRLEDALPVDLPPLCGHPHRLTRVFNNLFSNAIKYTDRGRVRISAEPRPGDGPLLITIEDTGSGIDQERLPKLFDYYQGDEQRPDSTGIGLAFVKQVVDALHGKVWMESKRGEGTRVYLEVPRWVEGGGNGVGGVGGEH